MRKIFDYKDIRKLRESTIAEELETSIIVTATAEMCESLRKEYSEYDVIDMHELVKKVIPQWEGGYDEKEKKKYIGVKSIKNYIYLRNKIEEYIEKNQNMSEKNKTCLRRNAMQMWNAIILLTEADIYARDIKNTKSEIIRQFKEIWEDMETDPEKEQFRKFRTTMAFELTNEKKVEEKVCEIFENKGIRQDKIKNKKIYAIGFYFITPIQMRLFESLERAGYEICYLNEYDSTYEFPNVIWNKTFEEEYEKKMNKDVQPGLSCYNAFGESLKGKPELSAIEIVKYESDFEFANKVKEAHDQGDILYTTNANQCEKILKEFFPEFYKKKHLLSYPVGQYIYNLHQMWNDIEEDVRIEFSYLYKCFASGWLEVGDINGRNFLYELKILEVYFKDCLTKEDWKKRMDKLVEAKDITSCFDSDGHTDRWQKVMGNPFRNISIYNIDYSILSNIKILFEQLVKDVETLFNKEKSANLREHFDKIKSMINRRMLSEEIEEEEKIIAEELIEQLSDLKEDNLECSLGAVKDAIILLIGDHEERYAGLEEETEKEDSVVKCFSDCDSSCLHAGDKKIHLLFGDEFNLPGAPKTLPWPITEEFIEQLDIPKDFQRRKYIDAMVSIIKNRPLSNRYLFFSLIGNYNRENNRSISIEWVSSQERKEVDASPYIYLMGLEKADNIEVEQEKKNTVFEEMIREVGHCEVANEQDACPMPTSEAPEEIWMDRMLCENRYIYGTILNEYASFSNEFHYSFLLSNMIKAMTSVSKIDKNQIAKNLYELFPFFREIESRQANDMVGKAWENISSCVYKQGEYPGERLYVHFLNKEVYKEARKQSVIWKDNDEEQKKHIGLSSRQICIYCPYSEICFVRCKVEDNKDE